MGSNETATATTGGPRVIMLLLPYFLLPQRRREIKIVPLGDSDVGKSSLAQRYVRAAARRRVIDVFSHSDATITAAFGTRCFVLLRRVFGGREASSEARRVSFGKN